MATDRVPGIAVLAILPCDRDREAFHDILQGCSARLMLTSKLEDARRLLDSEQIEVVITERNPVDDFDWQDVLREIENRGGLHPLIVTSPLADEALWAEVLNLGGFDVLSTPFEPAEVVRVIGFAQREHIRRSERRDKIRRRPGRAQSANSLYRTAAASPVSTG